jgi:hypothetical protein
MVHHPPESGNSQTSNYDASKYNGGPNPFTENFNYENVNHRRDNVDFSNQKRMNHSYDRHAKKCFGMEENRNKITSRQFKDNVSNSIQSPQTEKINESYRFETPSYLYYNEADNSFVTIINPTERQINNMRRNNNIGLDTRPNFSLTLRLRGPK